MIESGLTRRIISCALSVHRELGPGLLESVYATCLAIAFENEGLRFERERSVPITFQGRTLTTLLRADFIVENKVLIEVKAIDRILEVHHAQTLSYLRLSGLPVALMVNFHVPVLRDGITRFVNQPMNQHEPSP